MKSSTKTPTNRLAPANTALNSQNADWVPRHIRRLQRVASPDSSTRDIYAHSILALPKATSILKRSTIQNITAIFSATCSKRDAALLHLKNRQGHIHLLIRYPPTLAIADLLEEIKVATADHVSWGPGFYAARHGSASWDHIEQYLNEVQEPHNSLTNLSGSATARAAHA